MTPKQTKLLVINPNTTISITESFKPIISSLFLPNISFEFWTNPKGPAIIRNEADIYTSSIFALQPLLEVATNFDGFLVACYADHLLVQLLRKYVGMKPVVGIFDTSITTALHLALPGTKFGILTTGEGYEKSLTEGVRRFLGSGKMSPHSDIFGGVQATGICAEDLVDLDQTLAKAKVIEATRKLMKRGDISVICVGGALLIGMEAWIKEACVLELGSTGQGVMVIDQIIAGVMTLHSLVCIAA